MSVDKLLLSFSSSSAPLTVYMSSALCCIAIGRILSENEWRRCDRYVGGRSACCSVCVSLSLSLSVSRGFSESVSVIYVFIGCVVRLLLRMVEGAGSDCMLYALLLSLSKEDKCELLSSVKSEEMLDVSVLG